MKQKTVLLLIAIGVFLLGKTQTMPDPKWDSQYKSENWSATRIVQYADEIKFKPRRVDSNEYAEFKAALLMLTDPMIAQLNRDAWYLCSIKHDDYFAIWNLLYTKMTKDEWDKNCKGLLCLMLIDGTAKSR